jgi:hypothetical protein
MFRRPLEFRSPWGDRRIQDAVPGLRKRPIKIGGTLLARPCARNAPLSLGRR